MQGKIAICRIFEYKIIMVLKINELEHKNHDCECDKEDSEEEF